jgi:hypothetical protein
MRCWIAAALLAGSWLLGLDFYQPGSAVAWALTIALGAVFLAGFPLRMPRGPECLLAVALLAPAVWFFPWPYRATPLLLAIGLLLGCVKIPQRWPAPLGRGLVAGGLVLLAQSAMIDLYVAQTARCHDLPWPLPGLVGSVAWLLGTDAAVDGSTLVLGTLRGPIRLGATWELLFDPVTLGFFVGGLVLLGFDAGRPRHEQPQLARWLRRSRRLAAVMIVWLPIRTAILVAILLHRAVRWDVPERFNVMDQFLSPWVHLVLLTVPVLAAWYFVGMRGSAAGGEGAASSESARQGAGRYVASLASVLAAIMVFAWLWQWDPAGERLAGRIMFVERHSTWEPTTRPYDTTRFGEESSYTYAAVFDYCSRYYEMSRLLESDPVDEAKLATCDVLVVKIPTERFSADEISAIERFVDRGGRLLLIGEHTDVFKSSTFLNEIAKVFGFKFRLDLLFWFRDPYVQVYEPPRVPHPIVQHLPRMNFAVSCSVDPGWSLGRAAILNTGLWNLPPEYHTDNFFPEPEYRPEMRYGAFIQLWTTRYGGGRVAAWTDSTIFSNFSTFEPGKSELMLGMLEWLNHRSALDRAGPRWLVFATLGLLAAALMAGGLHLARRQRISSIVLLAAGIFGAAAGSALVAAAHRAAVPVPKPVRPTVRVIVDRTVSDVPLSRDGFTQENGLGYGLLEQWIPRLGYFTARRSGKAAFEGDVLVVVCPQKSVSEEYRQGLLEFVANGGKLLVLDSPDVAGVTANSLLWPFGLGVNHSESRKGKLGLAGGWPGIPLENVCEVIGGQPFMWVEGLPVAARVAYGRGRVMAIGFGSVMNDGGLGGHWMAEAAPDMLVRSDLLFALVQALVEDRPVVQPPPRKADPGNSATPQEPAGKK